MTLPNFIISSKVNQTYQILGLDCVEEALNPRYWLRYSKPVSYTFNSRGFRDAEWPDNLEDAIWCVGDSFTLGMGQPQNEIWPQLLQSATGVRTINVSLNGASNDWIARKVADLLTTIKPKAVCIQWSYLHRRELPDVTLPDEARTVHFNPNDDDDYGNFLKNIDLLPTDANIIHSWIPQFTWKPKNRSNDPKALLSERIFAEMTNRNAAFINDTEQLDLARDGHHYDIKTAQKYVDHYIEKLGASTWD